MNDVNEMNRILNYIRGQRAERCILRHDIEGSVSLESSAPGLIEIGIAGADIPAEWYVEITRALAEIGVRRIELFSWGWWIGEGDRNEGQIVRITDHIACHFSNPLTGSESARRGEAFIDMRGVYGGEIDDGEKRIVDGILWHTDKVDRMPIEEISEALSAGCKVAGPNVAPWAVCAKAAGLDFSAKIHCLSILPPSG